MKRNVCNHLLPICPPPQPRRPQGSPLGGSMGPRWPQERPKSLQERLKWALDGSELSPMRCHELWMSRGAYTCRILHTGRSPDGPKMAPRWLQDNLKRTSRGTRRNVTWAPEGPESAPKEVPTMMDQPWHLYLPCLTR